MKKPIFSLAAGFMLLCTQASAAVDIDIADAQYQCYRSLRVFVSEVYPDHVFVPDSKDNWKQVKSADKKVLKIEADDYIKIKPTLAPEYKSHTAYCSYYKPTMSVIALGISPPANPE